MTNSNPVAVITGASSGIGEAITKLLAKQGFAVVFGARRADKGQTLEAVIQADGGKAKFVQTDVNQESDVQSLVSAAIESFGTLDVAVNCAGVHRPQTLTESSNEDYDAVLNTNLKALWWSMKYEIEALKSENKGGVIINIGSNVGVNGAKNAALYVASKHAVSGLTKAAALDYAQDNIRVNIVNPGPVRTEMFENAVNGDPDVEAFFESWVPMGRVGHVDDVANAVAYLASPEAKYLTGASIAVDGGTLAGFN